MALGTVLLLVSAILHAAWNAFAKSSKDKEGFLFLTILISGVLTLGMVVGVDQGFYFGTTEVFGIAVLSGIFEGLYFITLTRALKEGSLGKSYAIMRGGAMVIVWLISSFFLGEKAELHHYLGALVILIGIFILNFQTAAAKAKVDRRDNNIWAYLSAIFIAGYHLAYHQALVREAYPRSLFTVAMFVSLPFLLWNLGKAPMQRIKHSWRIQWKRALLTGVFAMASFLIFLFGLKVSAPGFAISLRNSSIFFALLFSFFLKESLSRLQIVGALVVGIGTIVLSL